MPMHLLSYPMVPIRSRWVISESIAKTHARRASSLRSIFALEFRPMEPSCIVVDEFRLPMNEASVTHDSIT